MKKQRVWEVQSESSSYGQAHPSARRISSKEIAKELDSWIEDVEDDADNDSEYTAIIRSRVIDVEDK